MMSDTRVGTVKRAPGKTKLLGQMAAGFVTGGVGAYAMMSALDGASPAIMEDGSRIFALLTALVFALTGAVVLLGVLSPRFGAKALNVEDEEELREQRTVLGVSSFCFLLLAIFLAALALGGGETPVVPRTAAGIVAGVSAILVIALNAYAYRLCDELMMSMTREATMVCSTVLLLLFGGWAALAEFGQAAMFEPLDFVAGFFAIYLVSVFIVAGRRGLLKPR
jgi:MFS family permease